MTSLLQALQSQRGRRFERDPPFVLADIEQIGTAAYRARCSFRPGGGRAPAPPVELFRTIAASEDEARSVVTAQVTEAQQGFPTTRFFLILETDRGDFVPMALFEPGSASWEKVLPTRWSCPRCGRSRTYTRVHGVLPPLCCGTRQTRMGTELDFEIVPSPADARAVPSAAWAPAGEGTCDEPWTK